MNAREDKTCIGCGQCGEAFIGSNPQDAEGQLAEHKRAHADTGKVEIRAAAGNTWVPAKRFEMLENGWVNYRLKGNTQGLARPSRWRFA